MDGVNLNLSVFAQPLIAVVVSKDGRVDIRSTLSPKLTDAILQDIVDSLKHDMPGRLAAYEGWRVTQDEDTLTVHDEFENDLRTEMKRNADGTRS